MDSKNRILMDQLDISFQKFADELEAALDADTQVLPEVEVPIRNYLATSKQYIEVLKEEISNLQSQLSITNKKYNDKRNQLLRIYHRQRGWKLDCKFNDNSLQNENTQTHTPYITQQTNSKKTLVYSNLLFILK